MLDRIAQMDTADPVLAERAHATGTANAPGLLPRPWYGITACANEDGKIVVFFQAAGKCSYCYSTIGFQDSANLDDDALRPVSYALTAWNPAVEKKVAQLMRAAVTRGRRFPPLRASCKIIV